MLNNQWFSNSCRSFLVSPPVKCGARYVKTFSNSLFVPQLFPVCLFTFFFFLDPKLVSYQAELLEIPAGKSQPETWFPAEGRKHSSFPVIDKRGRPLPSTCGEQILASSRGAYSSGIDLTLRARLPEGRRQEERPAEVRSMVNRSSRVGKGLLGAETLVLVMIHVGNMFSYVDRVAFVGSLLCYDCLCSTTAFSN